MLCGLIVLAAATALLAVGTSLPVLITGRALQGASGAIVWISGLALMVDTVGQKDVGQMMGYVGASLSLAFLIGPALGGVVAERAGYEGVFAMCWACIGLDIVLRLVMIEKKVAIKWLGLEGAYGTRVVTALPPPTAVEAAANDPKAVVAVPTTPSLPTTAAAVVPASGEVVTFPKSTVSGLASEPNTNHRSVSCPIVPTGASDINPSPKPFRSPSDSTLLSKKDLEKAYDSDTSRSSRTEIALPHHSNGIKFPTTLPRTNSAHVLPPKHITIDPDLYNIPRRPLSQRIPLFTLLKSPRLLASLFAVMIQSALLTSLDSTVPLRVRDIFHWGSLGAGLVFLALTLPTFLGPLVGWWVDHHGPRLPGALSYVLGVPFFVLLRLIQDDTTSAKVGFCALLAGIGLSIGLAISPIMVEISNVVVDMERKRPGIFGEKGAMAQAYALFNLFFAAGSLIGESFPLHTSPQLLTPTTRTRLGRHDRRPRRLEHGDLDARPALRRHRRSRLPVHGRPDLVPRRPGAQVVRSIDYVHCFTHADYDLMR